MRRRICLATAAAVAMPWSVRAPAQSKSRRVGILFPGVDPGSPPPGATEAWKKVGWVEGETLLVERKYAGWRAERMPELTDALLRRHGAQLLIANGSEAAAAAARATQTVPILFNYAYLPIECGLIDSYARPGRNLTGAALFTGPEATIKRAEFLRAIAPSARRGAVLTSDPAMLTVSGAPLDLRAQLASVAKVLGFESTIHYAPRIEDVEAALADAPRRMRR
jgi:putative ABC transport system substrate-binding protein